MNPDVLRSGWGCTRQHSLYLCAVFVGWYYFRAHSPTRLLETIFCCVQYSTSNWLVIAAKFRLIERRKAEIRRRAHVGRLIDNLESKNEALTEV